MLIPVVDFSTITIVLYIGSLTSELCLKIEPFIRVHKDKICYQSDEDLADASLH